MEVESSLLEREREIAALERLLDRARESRGAVVLIEGPAGIGKTRLLAATRERACGMPVLGARCSELEREFSFGTVRQLLEPLTRDSDQRARLLAGAGAAAEGVLGAPGGDAEGTFAVLHGLYWATLNLAEERPVLIAIDDLQWSDRPSLRFVAYLAARLEDAPVLVAASVRTTDPGTDPQLLAEIAALAEAVRPAPLGTASVANLVQHRLGAADGDFIAACLDATGGNPLLLRHVLTALAEDGVKPTAAGAAAVRGIGSRAVSRTVLLRLSRLHEEAAAVARAVAVLGESSKLPAVAALTGLSEDAVAQAAGDLARADILRPDPPLGFVHPLVRDAVYLDIPAGERELQHGRAAAVLTAAGAADEEVAAQFVHAPRRGDAATVELLRSAAHEAARRGGPENAMVLLQRALEEPPAPELRPRLHFDTGLAASETNAPLAVEHLALAYEGLTDPAAKATAAFALAQSQLFIGAAQAGGALARRAAAETPDELADVRLMIESIELLSVFFDADPAALDRLAHYRHEPVAESLGAKMMAAASAFAWAAAGGPAREVEALMLAAWEGGDLLANGNGLMWSAISVAAMLSESPRAPAIQAQIRETAYRRGGVFGITSTELFEGAYLLLAAGDVEQGAEAVGIALATQDLWGSDPTADSWARGLAGLGAFLTGDPAAARTAVGPLPPVNEGSDGANLCRRAMAEILLSEARPEHALELAEQMGAMAAHVRHPDWKPWQSLKARALAQLGRGDEALAAMAAELELAHGVGADRVIGRCLRQLGELEGDDGEPRLVEAIERLRRTPARLELARALGALGALQRRLRRPTEAREPLRQALELAEACGCRPLADALRSELYATGARPRTAALGGVESLTARELRVATLARDGQTNREIAQSLFVTPKTVEVHLSSAYRKLDIRSRRDLAGALAGVVQ
jgi:DNA-binding CsgD family transcriptional regulator